MANDVAPTCSATWWVPRHRVGRLLDTVGNSSAPNSCFQLLEMSPFHCSWQLRRPTESEHMADP